MLGLLGAAIFGAVYFGAWASANKTEQEQRNNSQKNGIQFYCDKNGRMRHTDTGKKFTPEEVHNYLNPDSMSLKEKFEQMEKESRDKLDNKYFTAYNAQNHSIREVFLTEEEAIRYVKENYDEKDYYYWKTIGKVCKQIIILHKDKYHLNFDERSW